jgi:hypothetical protein
MDRKGHVTDNPFADCLLGSLKYEAQIARHGPEVRSLRCPNAGPGLARETGRVESRGEFIQYLGDDLLLSRKLEDESRQLLSATSALAPSWDMRLFGGAANRVRWRLAGRVAEALDRIRV